MTLILRTHPIERHVVEFKEASNDFVAGNLFDLYLTKLTRCGRLGRAFDLQLVIRAFDLAEGDSIRRSGQNETADARLRPQVILVHLVHAIDDE